MTDDRERKIHELKDKIKEFCDVREWDKYHNAKDLAIGLSIEASELLEIFLWKNPEEVENLFVDEKKREHIEEEMADIFYFLIRLSEKYNIDLSQAIDKKLEKNNQKYPVEKVKGLNKKYNEY
ncbi:MAG: nucleotide pyrophosphohydrolase [Candidatus Pacearchaeota archaeon]|jgi:NTP pyrophosphatase (non-canonical NTP hydrolase)